MTKSTHSTPAAHRPVAHDPAALGHAGSGALDAWAGEAAAARAPVVDPARPAPLEMVPHGAVQGGGAGPVQGSPEPGRWAARAVRKPAVGRLAARKAGQGHDDRDDAAQPAGGATGEPAPSGQPAATSDDGAVRPAITGDAVHHGGGGTGHLLPYLIGGVAVIGGGVAAASGKGSSSTSPSKVVQSVDTPALALAQDTGASATDGITNRGGIAVSSLQADAKWEYSTDNGATWSPGTGSSFTLPQGTYAAGTVQVRQTSSAGTVSAVGRLAGAVTVDTTIVAPTIDKVTGDNVLTIAEATAAGGVTVRGTGEPGATISLRWMVQDKLLIPTGTATVGADGKWTYTFKGTAVPDASFKLDTQIKISATDLAGNTSDVVVQTVTTDPGVTVTGTITAGSVIGGNDLTVNLYDGSGKLLAAGIAVRADGTFSAKGLAVGRGDVVIATLVNGPAADYRDEASGQARNLTAGLIAAVTIGDPATTLNINPLTSLAAGLLGLSADGKGALTGSAKADAVDNANRAVAAALGLGDANLVTLTPTVIPDQGFPADATLDAARQAGVLLAALSGLDAQNGGNAQKTIDGLVAALTLSGGKAVLGEAGLAALLAGAQTASARLGVALVGQVAGQIAAATAGATAPVTIDRIAGDDVINRSEVGSLVLSGKVAAGATAVSLKFSGTAHAAVISGTDWSYALTADDVAALGASGPLVILASATLPDGSVATSARPALLALAAPAAPTFDPVLGDDRISAVERDGGVVVSGRGDPGSTVAVTWNGRAAPLAVVGANGTWSTKFQKDDVPATEGASQLSAQATDRFGNTAAAEPRTVTVDLTAPGKPGIDAVAEVDVISPALAQAGVVVSGTAEAFAKVRISWDGTFAREVTADDKGAWRTTFAAGELPGDGPRSLSAYQIDQAGNVGDSSSRTVLLLQQAQGIALAPIAGGDGINQADAVNGVTVTGVAAPGSVLLLDWGGAPLRTAVTNANGVWQVTYQLTEIPIDGDTLLSISGKNANGDALAPVTQRVVIDTVPPARPTVDLIAGDKVINYDEKTKGVTISGTGEKSGAGHGDITVSVTWGGTTHTKTVSTDGTWSVTFTRDEIPGDTDKSVVLAKLTDALGNESLVTREEVAIRTALPPAPTLALAADTGTSSSDGVTRDGRVQVSGLVPGATWEYSTDGENWNTGRGSSFTLLDDTYPVGQVRVRQTDPSGNPSAEGSFGQKLIIQSAAPLVSLGPVTDDGIVNAQEKDAGVSVSGFVGNLVEGVPVVVTVRWTGPGSSGTTSKAATLKADGSWEAFFTKAEIPGGDGSSTVVVEAVDAAGGRTVTVPRLVPVNTAIPPAPVLTLRSDTGISATDGTTKDPVLNVSGITGRQAWEYSTDGGKNWEPGGAGNGTLTLGDGDYKPGDIQVRQIDSAQNPGVPAVYGSALVIDTSTPSPTIDPLNADNLINAALKGSGVVLSGTAEAGAVVTLTWRGRAYTTTAEAVTGGIGGRWSIRLSPEQVGADGTLTFTVSAVDVAGNRSLLPDTSADVTIDTKLPAAPSIDRVAGDNVISSAEKAQGVTITGRTEIGTKVKVTFGALTKDAEVQDNGTWRVTFQPGEVPPDAAAVSLSAVATNARDNTSLPRPQSVEIDTFTPTPTVTAVNGTNTINAVQKADGVEVSGTAEAGAIVVLTLGLSTVSATADANGVWKAKFAGWQVPADGPATLTVVATDPKGNVSEPFQQALSIDTVAPPATTLGPVAGDNIVTVSEAANKITVSGFAAAGSRVALSWDGQSQTVIQNPDGSWSAQVTVKPGATGRDVAVVASVSDAAGNPGVQTARIVRVAGTADTGPTIAPVTADDRINAEEKGGGVRISGLGAPDSLVDLAWDGRVIGQAQVGANGVWTYSIGGSDLPADGAHVLSASGGGLTASRSVLVDTVAPAAPTNITLAPPTSGASLWRVSGTAEDGATVQLSWGGVVKTAQLGPNGQWFADFKPGELPSGSDVTLRATATDAAGNVSQAASIALTPAITTTGTEQNDTLVGRGNGDVLLGLGGDDILILPDLAFRSIDGGAGRDTLRLGAQLGKVTLDLTKLGANQKLANIEEIDLRGGGANHLVVDQAAILADTGGGNALWVTGDADERVTAFGFVKSNETASVNDHLYLAYKNGSATLWIDQNISNVVI